MEPNHKVRLPDDLITSSSGKKVKVLKFTTKVLGLDAAGNLKIKDITQTIRGSSAECVKQEWKCGDVIEVQLDGNLIGTAKVLSLNTVKWCDLKSIDVNRGGFENKADLAKALRRAGYRFSALEAYKLYRLRFVWDFGIIHKNRD